MLFATICVMGVRAVEDVNVIFEDTFDSYTTGSFPSSGGWNLKYNGIGTSYQIVDNSQSTSSPNSLKLEGQANWAATADYPLSTIADQVVYEGDIKVTQPGSSAMNYHDAEITFANPNVNTWGTHFASVKFGRDENRVIYLTGTSETMPYDFNQWYHVKASVDNINKQYSVWIDGALLGSGTFGSTGDYTTIRLIGGNNAHTRVWFDNVKVYQENIDTTPPSDVKTPIGESHKPVNIGLSDDFNVIESLQETIIKSFEEASFYVAFILDQFYNSFSIIAPIIPPDPIDISINLEQGIPSEIIKQKFSYVMDGPSIEIYQIEKDSSINYNLNLYTGMFRSDAGLYVFKKKNPDNWEYLDNDVHMFSGRSDDWEILDETHYELNRYIDFNEEYSVTFDETGKYLIWAEYGGHNSNKIHIEVASQFAQTSSRALPSTVIQTPKTYSTLIVTDTWSPAWSSDGESIAYVSYDDSRNQQVFTMSIDGSGKKRITETTNRKWGVTWLKEGISYISYDTDGLQKIYIIQPDGSGTRKLLDDQKRQGREPSDELSMFGEVSENPVTGKILFTSYNEIDKETIYEINIDGTGKKQVINDGKRQWDPEWNPDGTSFVYVSYDESNNMQIFTANADGTGKKQLTSDDVKKYDPNWGPDGILFVSFIDRFAKGEKLYIINPDGTGKELIIEDSFIQIYPRWSADGTKVLYIDIKENIISLITNSCIDSSDERYTQSNNKNKCFS